MRKIVAFIGRAGSGKDYQCSLLQQKGYKKIAFADCLREMAAKVIGLDYDEMIKNYDYYKSHEVVNGLNLRHILENLGSSIRMIEPDFFVKAVLRKITSDEYIDENICISDMRYPNEFYYLDNMNGGHTKFTCKFCDYRSERYQEINEHESAKLSNSLVKLGYKDLQDLTRKDIDLADRQLSLL